MEKDLENIFLTTVEANKDRIFRLCRSYTTDADDAKDLFQEVLINLWKSLPSFKHRSNIDTWVYRITINICLRAKQFSDKKHKPDNYSLPVKDYLVKYQQYLVKERNLLKNVIYWYLLPPFISSVLFFFGLNMSITWLIISILFVSGINAYVYFLNKAGVKKVFDPLIKKIDETIKNIKTTD